MRRLALALLLISGCAGSLRQPYKPTRETNLRELNAQSLGETVGGECQFGANPPREWGLGLRESEIAGKKAWLVVVQYKGLNAFGIQGGDSLTLKLDGKAKPLNIAPLDIEKKALGQYLLERAPYAASLDLLKQLASAKKAELGVRGASRTVTLCVPDFARANMRRWLAEELGLKKQKKN